MKSDLFLSSLLYFIEILHTYAFPITIQYVVYCRNLKTRFYSKYTKKRNKFQHRTNRKLFPGVGVDTFCPTPTPQPWLNVCAMFQVSISSHSLINTRKKLLNHIDLQKVYRARKIFSLFHLMKKQIRQFYIFIQ